MDLFAFPDFFVYAQREYEPHFQHIFVKHPDFVARFRVFRVLQRAAKLPVFFLQEVLYTILGFELTHTVSEMLSGHFLVWKIQIVLCVV